MVDDLGHRVLQHLNHHNPIPKRTMILLVSQLLQRKNHQKHITKWVSHAYIDVLRCRLRFHFISFSLSLSFLQVQRSVSQGDMNDANGRRIRSSTTTVACSATNNGTKLKRCASLPAQKQRSVPYMSSKETENLKLQLESSVESLGECIALL